MVTLLLGDRAHRVEESHGRRPVLGDPLTTWGATARGTYGTPEAGTRTAPYVPWRTSCPVPQVRTLRKRPVHVAHTFSTAAPGRTCQHSSRLITVSSSESRHRGMADSLSWSACAGPRRGSGLSRLSCTLSSWAVGRMDRSLAEAAEACPCRSNRRSCRPAVTRWWTRRRQAP